MAPSAHERPRVTVLMPMRNAEKYVEAALRSILLERDVPLEVIVTDDGSTDRSRAIVAAVHDPRVHVIDGPCEGIAAAFNAALDQAAGDLLMRCDADDLYPPDRISRQVRWLDEHQEFGAICGGFAAINSRGRSEMPFGTPGDAGEITSELQNGFTRTHLCTFAVGSAVIRHTGGMRSFFLTGEDIDLQLRIGEACRVWYSPEVAYRYRIHDASITHTRHERENEFFENLAREFQVQRRSHGADDLRLGKAPEVPNFGLADRGSAKSHMQGLLIGRSWAAAIEGDIVRAVRYAFQAAVARPLSLAGWRNLAVILIKAPAGLLRSNRQT